MINRRHLFALSSLTAAAGALGTGGVVLSWWDQAPARGYLHFSLSEVSFLETFAGTVFPATATIPVSGDAVEAARFLDSAMGAMPEMTRNLLRLLLHTLENATRVEHLAPFQDLSADIRAEVVDQWLDSSIAELRSATDSLVILVGMAYTSHPAVSPFFSQLYRCGFGR